METEVMIAPFQVLFYKPWNQHCQALGLARDMARKVEYVATNGLMNMFVFPGGWPWVKKANKKN